MTQPFEHAGNFEQGELSGNLSLGKFEAHYEALFSVALADGIITDDERAALEKAAGELGIDPVRVRSLEEALTGAWEHHHHKLVSSPSQEPAMSLRPMELESDPQVRGLRKRIQELEERVQTLEAELERAQQHIEVDIDFSDMGSPSADDRETLTRRLRHDPRDKAALSGLFSLATADDPDLAFRLAHVLVFLGDASPEQRAFHQERAPEQLIKPGASLNAQVWQTALFHPDEERLTGEILSIVTSPVLLGRLAALRHHGVLETPDPATLQNPATSTVASVRCVTWAASILGMNAPPLYAMPGWSGSMAMVPAMPPAAKLGKHALSGRNSAELAFMAGRHLASYREDHFLKMLLPNIQDLEDIFLAALTVGQPNLPLSAQAKERALPIARAIEPLLETAQKDRLRGYFKQFVEEGGRTNLNRWAHAADLTALRAGLLLGNDLTAAKSVLVLDGESDIDDKINDLIVFYTSDRCGRLRAHLRVAVS